MWSRMWGVCNRCSLDPLMRRSVNTVLTQNSLPGSEQSAFTFSRPRQALIEIRQHTRT